MKIVCPNCGKKYNYEKQMGICPSCTKYTSYTEVQRQSKGLAPSVIENKEAYNSSQDSIHDVNSMEYHGDFDGYQMYTPVSAHTDTARVKSTLLGNILAIIIAIVMIGAIIAVFFFFVPNKVSEISEYYALDNVERKNVEIDEVVVTSDENFSIGKSKILEPELFSPPEGWKYVYVPYTYIEDFDYSPTNYVLEVYLNVNDSYIEPVTEYDLPDMDYNDSAIKSELERLRPAYYPNYYDECFIFIVPVDVTEYTLCIYEYERSQDFYARKLIGITEHHIIEEQEAIVEGE